MNNSDQMDKIKKVTNLAEVFPFHLINPLPKMCQPLLPDKQYFSAAKLCYSFSRVLSKVHRAFLF